MRKPLSAADDGVNLLLPALDRASEVPLFRQLHGALAAAILAGTVPPGARLPASRALAARLGIARSAVVGVYEQLLAEGYAEGRGGSGTFAAPRLPEGAPVPIAPPPPGAPVREAPGTRFAALRPDGVQEAALPFNTGRCTFDGRSLAAWRRIHARLLRRADPASLGYGDPRGDPALRDAIARYLRIARGVRAEAADVLVLSGTQQGMDLAFRTLLEPGDAVWIEDPTYPAMLAALQAARARVVPVPVDAEGIVVAAGRRAAPRAVAAYVTPSHQAPSGAAMSMARRLELLAWARDAGAWIIEDDYDSEFRYAGRPLSSLQGMDRDGRVIYLGTFSKVLFPGLRLGYAVVPPALRSAMAGARHLADRHGPALAQAATAAFMAEGHFAAHLRRMTAAYRGARDALVAALHRHAPGLAVEAPEAGMYAVARPPPGMDDVLLARHAAAAGLVLRPMSPAFVAAPPVPALTLGFTGFGVAELEAAAARLGRVMERVAAAPGPAR